ncbi:hypothetical protein GZL_04662 [Streptomyces sp. 769]|nr:hypothetical protein GZL_04662 [Streptomyces sp. 769]
MSVGCGAGTGKFRAVAVCEPRNGGDYYNVVGNVATPTKSASYATCKGWDGLVNGYVQYI